MRKSERGEKRGLGAFTLDVRIGRGKEGSPKSRQKEQNQLISLCDEEERVQTSDHFADVI